MKKSGHQWPRVLATILLLGASDAHADEPSEPTARETLAEVAILRDPRPSEAASGPAIDTALDHIATWAVHTDVASFELGRARLDARRLPVVEEVRVEAFANAATYGHAPAPGPDLHLTVDVFPSPARRGHHVLHVGFHAPDTTETRGLKAPPPVKS